MCSERIRPPGTGSRLRMVDATPSRASECASVQPVRPPPTIRIFGVNARGTSPPYIATSWCALARIVRTVRPGSLEGADPLLDARVALDEVLPAAGELADELLRRELQRLEAAVEGAEGGVHLPAAKSR